jgi:hypothetical protein
MYIKENRESINISRTNNNHSPQLIQKKTLLFSRGLLPERKQHPKGEQLRCSPQLQAIIVL